jgi:ABC-type Fe3+ transport system substrate-binding protein
VYLGGQTTGLQLSQLKLSEEFKPPAENAPGAKWVVAPSSYTSYPQIIYALQGKGILINTQLVPPDKEPKNWTDLLDPFWSDKKIVVDHPGRGGGPGSSWARWADESPDLGRAFLTGLKNQDPVLASGSATPQIEALARGEYYAYIPAYPSALVQAPGAPVKFIWPGPQTSGTTSLLILIKNAPHPNAAKLFLNMALLPEFQKLIADDQWTGPNLLGVPVANPLVSLEGRKVYIDKEADIIRTTDWANSVGKEIFGN